MYLGSKIFWITGTFYTRFHILPHCADVWEKQKTLNVGQHTSQTELKKKITMRKWGKSWSWVTSHLKV